MSRVQIAPSVLAADFTRLADEAAVVGADADWLHVDVMDNHFVPNLTIGLPVVAALLRVASLPLDCHLMITDPDRWAPDYARAGAGSVTVHAEAAADPLGIASRLHAAGARAGLAIKPATPVDSVADLLPDFDMLLVMTVEPGFGGQPFLEQTLDKVASARRLLDRHGLALWLQVDGGITEETAERAARAGADVFVAGSAVYGAADPGAAVRGLRATAERATAERATPDGAHRPGDQENRSTNEVQR
ncbi:MAG: ribulose-phosphate 3-epimerase [Mycobacteriales bacterium]